MKLLATAAAAFAAVTFAIPAQASPLERQIGRLFKAIEASGTTIVLDDPRVCKDKDTLGHYEHKPRVIDQLTICMANHNGDGTDLYDTILHESVHVAQACAKTATLFSVASIRELASPKTMTSIGRTGYGHDEFDVELEARVIAANGNIDEVTGLIKKHCVR